MANFANSLALLLTSIDKTWSFNVLLIRSDSFGANLADFTSSCLSTKEFGVWPRWIQSQAEPHLVCFTNRCKHVTKNGFLPERVFLFYCNQQGYQENENLVEPLFLSSPTRVVTCYYCFRNMVTTNGRILKRVHCNHICGISLIATTLACSSGNSILFAIW